MNGLISCMKLKVVTCSVTKKEIATCECTSHFMIFHSVTILIKSHSPSVAEYPDKPCSTPNLNYDVITNIVASCVDQTHSSFQHQSQNHPHDIPHIHPYGTCLPGDDPRADAALN